MHHPDKIDRMFHDADTNTNQIIHTSSPEETQQYLARLGFNIHLNLKPEIIKKTTAESSVTYERRVIIQCIQPHPLPKPGPLIIKKVRPEQPPPPAPIVIHERSHHMSSDAPIILRERPPMPSSTPEEEIRIEYLPPVPVPPPSVIVHRFPAAKNIPQDLYIERWCDYPSLAEREIIYEPPPPPVEYPEPTYKIIEYDDGPSTVVTKVEKRNIVRDNPDTYVARYGSSLLDPRTLEQRVRAADVDEDIRCICPKEAKIMSNCERVNHYDQRFSYEYTSTASPPSRSRCMETTSQVAHTKVTSISNDKYSSSVTRNARTGRQQHQSSSEEEELS